tara:strand:+ start:1045 stop:2448 length:1404 start_codon:yes stop_codon:yes gene_type:complete
MSKGGSTTSAVTIPEYIEAAAQRNLNKAERISQIGYTPYYGPDVAAFTPMQQAAFQNTADTAGAFGMAGGDMSQQDIMGGMGPATQYAGGVSGYSAAPIYEQALQTLGEKRPGQKAYIDSFFIDPYTGAGAAGNFAPIDYTDYQTGAQMASGGNDGAGAGMPAGTSGGSYSDFASGELSASLPGGVNDPFLTSPISQAIAAATDTEREVGAPTTSLRPVERPDGLGEFDPSGQASQYITNPDGSITNTGTAGTGEQIMNDLTEFGTGLASNTLLGSVLLGPSYNVGGVNNPIETPTVNEMIQNAPAGMTYNPSTGSYVASPVVATNDNNNSAHSDMMSTATSSAPVTSIRPISRADADNGADTGDSGGCVVATHAVNSGAFSPTTKREAVVWCMNVLHGKWWGEAIRRGYRHLGRSKIEQGKAAEHYQEFRNYIAFATGKKRTVKGALHFAARTVQFLVVGLVKKDA